MWLRLTFYNGQPIVINFDFVEAFGVSEENGANSYITIKDASYHVKEQLEEIEAQLLPKVTGAWK